MEFRLLRKSAHLDIPVVFLTAYSDNNTLQRAKSTSPYGYIIKPYPDKELQLTLETALQKHQEYRDKVEIIRHEGLGKGVPVTQSRRGNFMGRTSTNTYCRR